MQKLTSLEENVLREAGWEPLPANGAYASKVMFLFQIIVFRTAEGKGLWFLRSRLDCRGPVIASGFSYDVVSAAADAVSDANGRLGLVQE